MAIYWPTPGFKGRTFMLCVLTRWEFNFCVRSYPLQGQRWFSKFDHRSSLSPQHLPPNDPYKNKSQCKNGDESQKKETGDGTRLPLKVTPENDVWFCTDHVLWQILLDSGTRRHKVSSCLWHFIDSQAFGHQIKTGLWPIILLKSVCRKCGWLSFFISCYFWQIN